MDFYASQINTPRRSPEQIIEQLEKLVVAPNLAADVGPIARQEFVNGVNRISTEVFQLHTIAQQNRALLRVDIALTQLRNASTAATDDRVKALQALRQGLSGPASRLNGQTTSILQNTVQGFSRSADVVMDPTASAADRGRATAVLAGGAALAVGGLAGGIMAVASLFKKHDPNAPRESTWKRIGKALLLPASIIGLFVLGAMGRPPRENGEPAAREIIGPTVNSGSVAGLLFERRTLPGGTAPETVIMHNGVPYRFALRWPPAAATGGGAVPSPREDNWSAQLSNMVDRGARINGGVGMNFSGGVGPLGAPGETRLELGSIQQLATSMPLSTEATPATALTRIVFLRFPLGGMNADQRLFVQEQIRVGAPVVIEGNEVRVQATLALRAAGPAVGATAAPAEYTAIPSTMLDVRSGEQSINLGTTDSASITLSVPGQPNSVQSMAGTGTVTVTSGAITLVRTGPTLVVRQNPPAPVPGTAIVSILRQREPSPRSVPIRFGPLTAEAPAKADTAVIDGTGRYVIPSDFPNETLTVSGQPVLVGANRTTAGRFLVSRSPNGATMTIAPADPALPMVDLPLTISGGGINRTIRFTYTPEVAPVAFRLPATFAFSAATPSQTVTGVPPVELMAGTQRIAVDIPASAPLIIGSLKITRTNGGRTMLIQRNVTTAIDQTLTLTGAGGINTTARYTAAPEVAPPPPFMLPGTISLNAASPTLTITTGPTVVLTSGTDTIGLETTAPVVLGPVRVSRTNGGRTIVIDPTDRTAPLTNHALTFTGPGGINTTTRITYVPPAPVIPTLPAATVLTPGTPSTEFLNMPARVLTVNGEDVAINGTRTVGNLRIRRSNGGATMTVEVVTAATAITNFDLTIGGTGLTSRTTRVNYVPPAPGEIPLAAAITLTGTPPRSITNGIPTQALSMVSPGPVTSPLAVDANVTIGNLRIRRSAGGATMTIDVVDPDVAVTDYDLSMSGTGLTTRPTRINYAPPAPSDIPLAEAITLTGTPPRSVTTGIPARELSMASPGPTTTALPLNADVTVGNLRIRRSTGGTTMTIEVVNPDTAITNVDLAFSGARVNARTSRINYVPPAPEEAIPLAAAITLTGTPPRSVTTGIPARELTLTTNPGPVTTALPLNADVAVGNLRIRRSTGGTTMTIEAVNATTAITNYDLVFSGTRVVSRTSRINYMPPAPFVVAESIALTGTPPSTVISGLPDAQIRVGNTIFPVDETERTVGSVKVKRAAGGRSMTVTAADATMVVNQPLQIRFGDVDVTTTITYTPPLQALAPAVTISNTTLRHTINNIPAGELRVRGRVLAVNGTVAVNAAGEIVANDAANIALLFTRVNAGELQCTAVAAVAFTTAVPIQRNGDAAATDVTFTFNP